MKIFLTGGTGFIGQPLTRQLLGRGWRVTALVRNPQSSQAQAIQTMGATLVQGDLNTLDTMRMAMTGADVVIHNAGVYEYGVNAQGKRNMYEANVTGTENVLRLAQELKIPRVLYVSSTWAYGETGIKVEDETFKRNKPYYTYYEQTKTEAHEIALKYQQGGLPLIIACPNGVIGINDHSVWGYFLRLYVNYLLVPFAWAPDISIALVHVDDLAEGLALAVEKGQLGETYLFAGEAMKQRDILSFWATRPGGFKVRFYIPSRLAYFMFAPLEPLQQLLGLPAFISRETVKVTTNLNYSSAKAKSQLGWTHRSAMEAWSEIVDAEIELRAKRKTRNPITLLKPL